MTAPRRARRTDGNQTRVVKALRSAGCSVEPINGRFDLLVGRMGVSYVLEVKDGSKPPSARRLTKREQEFKDGWLGHYAVVNNPREALLAVGFSEDAAEVYGDGVK